MERIIKTSLYALVIALAAAWGVVFYVLNYHKFDVRAYAQKAESACLRSANQGICYENELALIAERADIRTALKVLDQLIAGDALPGNYYRCHELGHHLSRTLYGQLSSDIRDAVGAALSATCNEGYLHGILREHVAENVKNLSAAERFAINFCDTFRGSIERNLLRSNCYHSIGHALLVFNSFDLTKALSGCDAVSSDKSNRRNCDYGVFMEDIFNYETSKAGDIRSSAGTWSGAKFPVDAVLAKCAVILEEHKSMCYEGMMRLYFYYYYRDAISQPEDFMRFVRGAFDICKSVNAAYQDECFFGLGTGVFHISNGNRKTMWNYCSEGVTHGSILMCISGIAAHPLFFKDNRARDDYCRSFPKEFVDQCAGRLKAGPILID